MPTDSMNAAGTKTNPIMSGRTRRSFTPPSYPSGARLALPPERQRARPGSATPSRNFARRCDLLRYRGAVRRADASVDVEHRVNGDGRVWRGMAGETRDSGRV